MMRRTVIWGSSLVGNGVIGIRREDKNVWERRVPLNPDHVKALLKRGKVKKVIVQPSTIRCYDDTLYAKAGAEINEDVSEASTICAVKEVPQQLLLADRTYMFFSHTIKAQAYNMPLLDTIMEKNIRVLDYERIVNEDGRMVKFGPYAGFAGMIDTLHALGMALLCRGFATPFLHFSLSKEYSSFDVARNDLREIGEQIRKQGLPKEVCPLTIAITGAGAVSIAAQQILHLLPCNYVEVEDLPKLWALETKDTHRINVVVVRSNDMVTPKDPSKKFTRKEYYATPQNFTPTFHERVAPYIHVLMNCMYWEPRFPRLLTNNQARELKEQNRFPLLCLGDITCDIGGSVEFFDKSTTIQNPFYVYNVSKNVTEGIHEFDGEGVVILGVDHLPAEFPREASTAFGNGLLPLIERVALSDGTADLDAQEKSLGPYIFNAQITNRGELTPKFQYIAKMRAENEANTLSKTNRITVFGAGMTSGPCIRHLLRDKKNSVCLIDSNQHSLDHITKNFVSNLGDESRMTTRKADLSKIDDALDCVISRSKCVVSLLPAPMHPTIAEVAIKHNVPLVTASYVSPGMEALRSKAEESGTVIINEMGLDPGIDIMTSADLFHKIRSQGGIIKRYVSLCGALCAPEYSDCPMGYKFSWSPRGVLTAVTRPCKFLAGGQWHTVEGEHLYHLIQPLEGFKGLNLNWIPNGDSEKYIKSYDLTEECDTCVRGTFRYNGYALVALAYQSLGMLNECDVIEELKKSSDKKITWRQLMKKITNTTGDDIEAAAMGIASKNLLDVRNTVHKSDAYKSITSIPLSRDPKNTPVKSFESEMIEVGSTFARLGLFSDDVVPKTADGFIIDSLCSQLSSKMSLQPHERDFNIMTHRVVAYFPSENKTRMFSSTLTYRGKDTLNTATAVTVGVPVAAAAQLVLDGVMAHEKGLVGPTLPALYRPVLEIMEKEGIKMVEEVYDIEE